MEEAVVEGKAVQFETGRLARLADGSCVVRHGDTTVLATAVYSREQQQPAGADFVPLQVRAACRVIQGHRALASCSAFDTRP
jgi:polyribonucleotide nucleotidyltransferase